MWQADLSFFSAAAWWTGLNRWSLSQSPLGPYQQNHHPSPPAPLWTKVRTRTQNCLHPHQWAGAQTYTGIDSHNSWIPIWNLQDLKSPLLWGLILTFLDEYLFYTLNFMSVFPVLSPPPESLSGISLDTDSKASGYFFNHCPFQVEQVIRFH